MTDMRHWWLRFHAFIFTKRHIVTEEVVCLLLVLVVFIEPASALRMQSRSLYMNSTDPGATTSYTVAFRYMSPVTVGSVDMLFCIDPIPYHACVTPPGLNVSNASLVDQSGETGYTIQSQSTNRIVLSRTPSVPGMSSVPSSYKFENIVNPTNTAQSFSIRLKTHATADATGSQIDFGSVKGQVTDALTIQTQVPPMLIFCVAEQVSDDCSGTNDNFYTDMGELDAESTLTAQSQMAVGTNASGGFSITANGFPMSAGTNVIDSPNAPTDSRRGTNQFGINLVANNAPAVGGDPEGDWANAVPALDYGQPNKYKYVSGDEVAFSPNVSLMKKFTVSYVLNSSEDLRAGIYSTTITYIASGRF